MVAWWVKLKAQAYNLGLNLVHFRPFTTSFVATAVTLGSIKPAAEKIGTILLEQTEAKEKF